MDLSKSLRQLPSAAWQALKDYFAGLRLFFNRENWSHSVTFIITLGLFIILALIQQPLRFVLWDPVFGLHQVVINSMRVMVMGGCGVFVGFLLLGCLAIFKKGQTTLFQSRFRHTVSPIVIIIMFLIFVFLLPQVAYRFPNLIVAIFSPTGLFFTIFTWSWIILIFLQVILLGYTIVKSVKWLVEYTGLPEIQAPVTKYWVIVIVLLIFIPVFILGWFPIVFTFMIDGLQPGPTPPAVSLPPFVLLLLNLVPGEYSFLLLLVTPIIIIVVAIAVYRRLPSVGVALASFGLLYPALVYYYRLRVNQYFINWSYLPDIGYRPPFANFGILQVLLLILTFAFVLLGAAKLQRNVSPNPFGLFAIMVGTMVFVLFWVIIPEYLLVIGVEYFGMIGSALSAFLALLVFIILPISYTIYRISQMPKRELSEETVEKNSHPEETKGSKDISSIITNLEEGTENHGNSKRSSKD
jgi:hypothetical protein